ncbi:type II secretion system protein [Acidovorax sp. ACV01]|uniref:type II secretion system protein n=1 Tax=Acidovorax sp. ACV01 TaxID=2769311 RepID=UPI00178471A7|nr:type II secretion system protein [Acidovorax sp. ACV01]MBD9395266.1 type II secretion system protein [Acidovorax sp. ACV01]
MVTINSQSKRRGFTLIEILIAMSILALLLTIALPQYFGSISRSKDVALQENLRVMRVVIDKYYGDKGKHPSSLEDLVQEKYLRSIPMDPITESAKTWVLIPHQDSENPGIVDVKSGAPGMSKDGMSYASM